jgi:hypothetical protein
VVNYASSDCIGIGILLTIVLSVLLRRIFSNYRIAIGKPLTIVLSILPRMTASDDLFGIFKLLAIALTVLPRITFLINLLVLTISTSMVHIVIV